MLALNQNSCNSPLLLIPAPDLAQNSVVTVVGVGDSDTLRLRSKSLPFTTKGVDLDTKRSYTSVQAIYFITP